MKWIVAVFQTEIRRIFAYRFDFWAHFIFALLANIGVAYFLWDAIFTARNVEQMQGYTFSGLMFYYLMVPLIQRTINGQSFSGGISTDIYEGQLTRYIIYPIHFFIYKFVVQLAMAVVYMSQLLVAGGVFIALFGLPDMIEISAGSLLMGFGAVFIATLLGFLCNGCIHLIAFWVDHIWSLTAMLHFSIGLLGGGLIPLSFFPQNVVAVLDYTPFPYFVSFPINCFLGNVSFSQWLTGVGVIGVWSAIAGMCMYAIWNRGKYAYTGVGI